MAEHGSETSSRMEPIEGYAMPVKPQTVTSGREHSIRFVCGGLAPGGKNGVRNGIYIPG